MQPMENLSSEDFLKLREIFFGELQQSQTAWLTPAQEPFLDIGGENVKKTADSFCLELGSISAMETVSKSISVANLTQEALLVSIEETDQNISAQWENNTKETFIEKGGAQSRLQVSFWSHTPEANDFSKSILLRAEMESGKQKEFNLLVTGKTLVDFPFMEADFNGSSTPQPYDFGMMDPAGKNTQSDQVYSLSIGNRGTEPLEVILTGIPAWLAVEFHQQQVVEEKTGFAVAPGKQMILTFQPRASIDFLGKNNAILLLQTNDIRPSFKIFELPFSVEQEVKGTYVTLAGFPRLEVTPGGREKFNIHLLNWGKQLALVSQVRENPRIKIVEDSVIPMLFERKPGKLELAAELDCDNLGPGDHHLELELGISGGTQDRLVIPVEIFVIKVEVKPENIDFGVVESNAEYKKTVEFGVLTGRELYITAKPLFPLKDFLTIRVVDSNSLEVDFHTRDTILETFSGPGIQVDDLKMNYHTTIPVSFQMARPGIEFTPTHITIETFKNFKVEKTFEIYNPGNGKLNVELNPGEKCIEIIGERKVQVLPGSRTGICFSVNPDQENEAGIKTYIELNTNVSSKEKSQVDIDLKVQLPAGKACPCCCMISELEWQFCPNCGADIREGAPVCREAVVYCQKCDQKYASSIEFCPEHGNHLVKLS